MNLSCVNEYVRVYAERSVILINNYIRATYSSNLINMFIYDNILSQNFINAFIQDCYFKLKNTISSFNYDINGESCFEYHDILHIYSFLKSQILASYPEISFEDIIINKVSNQIPIDVDEFIGLYVYSINNFIIGYAHYKTLLFEYKIKNHVQSVLMDKVCFKLLIQDYNKNPTEYENNYLDKLLCNRDLTKYMSEFIN